MVERAINIKCQQCRKWRLFSVEATKEAARKYGSIEKLRRTWTCKECQDKYWLEH